MEVFAGLIDFLDGTALITAAKFSDFLLEQDIQVKEGEVPLEIKETAFHCKVDNQVLKAVFERKGTLMNLALNARGRKLLQC